MYTKNRSEISKVSPFFKVSPFLHPFLQLLVIFCLLCPFYSYSYELAYNDNDFSKDQRSCVSSILKAVDVVFVNDDTVYEKIFNSKKPSMIFFYESDTCKSRGMASLAVLIKQEFTSIVFYEYKLEIKQSENFF